MALSTLLWRQVYRPCFNEITQPLRMCLAVVCPPQRVHEVEIFSAPQRRRLSLVAKVIVVDLRSEKFQKVITHAICKSFPRKVLTHDIVPVCPISLH